jgi:hypothetical protein
MIVSTLVGLTLVVSVSVDKQIQDGLGTSGSQSALHLSIQQKNAALRPLVRSATECVARTVSASPQFTGPRKNGDINDLIVESMTTCGDAMRAMIDGYDHYFGTGSGETFFAGPYLDVLPAAVNKLLDSDGH